MASVSVTTASSAHASPPATPAHPAVTVAGNESSFITPTAITIALEGSVLERKKRKFAHTSEVQRRCMLEWLEHPGNFQLLTKSKDSGVVLKSSDGKKIKKTDGFRALTHHINSTTGSNWTMEVTKSRYESFLTTYRKVKAQSLQPGFGVTENDDARGIKNISQKLNSLCVFYDRLDALFEPKKRFKGQPSSTSAPDSADSVPAAMDEQNFDELSTLRHAVDTPNQGPSTMHEGVLIKQLAMERQRLDLLQEQLAMQKRELDLRERELRHQEEERKRVIEIAAKMIEDGKSAAEVKSVLEIVLTHKSFDLV